MSLILEALRRSEAERRRGSPPSLLGEGAPPRVHRTSPWPIALGGLAVGLLLAGALAWWSARDRPAIPTDAAPVIPQAAPARPAAAQGQVEPPREPVPDAAYAAPPPAPAPAPALPPRSPTSSAAAASLPAVDEPTAIAKTPPPAPAAPTTDDLALGPRPGDLPLDALIGAQREALPPLRLSMHVYAEDPARRFAIVDGRRLREGDTFANGLQVLAIQRDGLRLAWQGTVLWVPR